jgi:hypothetical protein
VNLYSRDIFVVSLWDVFFVAAQIILPGTSLHISKREMRHSTFFSFSRREEIEDSRSCTVVAGSYELTPPKPVL